MDGGLLYNPHFLHTFTHIKMTNIYDLQDQLKIRIRLIVIAVIFSTLTVFSLESVLLYKEAKHYESLALIGVIAGFAFMRIALFILGSTLTDNKSRKIAFYSAVVLTLSFVGYFIAKHLLEKDFLSISNLILISISALSLLPAEWILGMQVKQKGDNELAIINDKRQKEEKREREIKEAKERKEKQELEEKGYKETIISLKRELEGLTVCQDQVEEMQELIDALNSAPKFPQELIGSKVILESGQMVRYCPSCFSKNIQTGNKLSEMYCKATLPSGGVCNTLIYKK